MNEQKKASKGKNKTTNEKKEIHMETSFIILFLLILVFGAVATKAVMKQYKRNSKDSYRYKDL